MAKVEILNADVTPFIESLNLAMKLNEADRISSDDAEWMNSASPGELSDVETVDGKISIIPSLKLASILVKGARY